MRRVWAGLIFLLFPSAALAQIQGQVLSVGFNNHYRPDCWTPMLVQLTGQSDQSTVYQIQVVQEDLDRDRVIYTQQVTLGGTSEVKTAATENFWVYFKPKPTDDGLPDATNLSTNLNTLNAQLKVFLCDKDGKQLTRLPITATILNSDPVRGMGDTTRSRKLVLFVTDGTDRPLIPDYGLMAGVLEDVDAVVVRPSDLPSSVLGYDAVDAIVWMDADANFLISGTRTPSLEAIVQWIHQGGHLVVCQPPEVNKVKPFADLLPVGEMDGDQWTIPMTDRPDVDVIQRILRLKAANEPWPSNATPLKVARVLARPDAKVDEWMEWPSGDPQFTPWLARRAVGLGAVTWVAQDLGNPALTDNVRVGWRYIWDRVFDWNNAPDVAEVYKPPTDTDDPWKPAEGIDLGSTLLTGMDMQGKAAAFVFIAVFFFFIYWLVAALGLHIYLEIRGKTELSWFLFAASALAGTLLTVLLVRLLLRGPPELRHVSVIRSAADDPLCVIDSRFGLYIPQDGEKKIDLMDTAEGQTSTITPFAINPQYVQNDQILPAYLEYEVPVGEALDADSVSITVPYRSSSKKLQTHWIGKMENPICVPAGMHDVKLVPPGDGGYIDGDLVNLTGFDLRNIYLAFQEPPTAGWNELSSRDQTWVIYVPRWAKGANLSLKTLTAKGNFMNLESADGRRPGGDKPVFGLLERGLGWDQYWQHQQDGVAGHVELAFPMLTLFEQIPPWRNLPDDRLARYELYRRGGRGLDLSASLSAGQLVICGMEEVDDDPAKTPLPVTLNVSDTPVQGTGTTIVQFVLPLDRSAMVAPPTTQASNQ
jgi:hypothetical protein